MKSLSEDLQTPKTTLDEFSNVTKRVLEYVPNVITNKTKVRGYLLCSSVIAGTTKYVRPIKTDLFIDDSRIFEKEYENFLSILQKIKNGERSLGKDSYDNIDRVIYTIQQSIGVGLDLLVNANSASVSGKIKWMNFGKQKRMFLTKITSLSDML
ncbi:hypothetical protein, partial [Thermincola ferriacetica]|uniref:hypothetical protein n=1 Tax=Thermincola ferriacetica TaxID=281456 RepID=UPI000AF4A24A